MCTPSRSIEVYGRTGTQEFARFFWSVLSSQRPNRYSISTLPGPGTGTGMVHGVCRVIYVPVEETKTLRYMRR